MTWIVNICFHGIGVPQRTLEPGEDRYWISIEMFHRVLDEVIGRLDVRLSFDDGNASDIEIGLPALADRGLSASFFVIAGRLDLPGSLARHDLVELRRSGMLIGTHGMTHVPWRRLSEVASNEEFVEARNLISVSAGGAVGSSAPPLGEDDREGLPRPPPGGDGSGFTSDRRRANSEAWLQPRYSLRADDTIDSFRRSVLDRPAILRELRASTVGLIKRLR